VLNFTAEQYAEYERTEACLRSKMRKRVRREVVALEMARRALASTSPATRMRYQVVVHCDSEVQSAWCETDRGVLPMATDELERGLAEGSITFTPAGESTSDPAPSAGSVPTSGVSRATLRLLIARSGGRCEVCRGGGLAQVHHKRPRSQGGGHELGNLELRCVGCHDLAHEKDYRERSRWKAARKRKRGRTRLEGRARDG